jgi:hypothetical protein
MPKLDINDLYLCMSFVYECDLCGDRFPIWWIESKEWKRSVFGQYDKLRRKLERIPEEGWMNATTVCKECFEKHTGFTPNYRTIDEYMAERYSVERKGEGIDRKRIRRVLEMIWDLPTQFEFHAWELKEPLPPHMLKLGLVKCDKCHMVYNAKKYGSCPTCNEKAEMEKQFSLEISR